MGTGYWILDIRILDACPACVRLDYLDACPAGAGKGTGYWIKGYWILDTLNQLVTYKKFHSGVWTFLTVLNIDPLSFLRE